jgi:hypothetical protein
MEVRIQAAWCPESENSFHLPRAEGSLYTTIGAFRISVGLQPHEKTSKYQGL